MKNSQNLKRELVVFGIKTNSKITNLTKLGFIRGFEQQIAVRNTTRRHARDE